MEEQDTWEYLQYKTDYTTSHSPRMNKIYDPTFSTSSYGFRPNKSAHQAIKQAEKYVNEGYKWVVDMDLEKFFDK